MEAKSEPEAFVTLARGFFFELFDAESPKAQIRQLRYSSDNYTIGIPKIWLSAMLGAYCHGQKSIYMIAKSQQ